jgi:hypothetical protein
MGKAIGLSLAFLALGALLLIRRRYVWVGVVALIYTWTYSLSVLLVAAALVWAVTLLCSERRFEWRPVAFSCAGVAAGFIINPYFPRDVRLLKQHLVTRVSLTGIAGGVGSEWYPFTTWEMLIFSFGACVAMGLGYVCIGYILGIRRGSRYPETPLFFLGNVHLSTMLSVIGCGSLPP